MKTEKNVQNYLFQPFRYIAGTKSLMYGLLILLLLSALSCLSRTYLDGVPDVHFAAAEDEHAPFFLYFGCVFVSWAIVVAVFYFTALAISGSVRPVDMAGTLALAKTPLILPVLLGFIPDMHITLSAELLQSHESQAVVAFFKNNVVTLGISLIVVMPVIIWVILLMYNAFSVSGNLKGTKGVISFIFALIVSELIFKLLFVLYLSPLFG